MICYKCRGVCYKFEHQQYAIPPLGSKWRMPKKNNNRAWKRIKAGDYWWDHPAIDKKAKKVAEWVRQVRQNVKRKKLKYRTSDIRHEYEVYRDRM